MAALKLKAGSFYKLPSYGRPLLPRKPFINTR